MKAIVNIGYKNYVMDAEKALQLLSVLEGAELYDSRWNSETKQSSYFIYPQDSGDFIWEMKILPDALYRLAKLAGKPE
jgi:hypothetical protein